MKKQVKEYFLKRWISKISGLLLTGLVISIELSREFLIAENLDKIEVIVIVTTFILVLLFTDNLERIYQLRRIKKTHYPKSFIIVLKNILPSFHENSKSSSNHSIGYNNTIDKIIKSPIDYTSETLSGNQAPIFNPNEKYLEDIYSEDLSHIVAITAENPNLWLDPTLCFYMTNCCAVSLINKFNNSLLKHSKLKIVDFKDDAGYEFFFKAETSTLLNNLRDGNINSFEFIRFIIFSEEQKDCLQNTVFPSLKASQDLFRIKSFFIQNDNIEPNLTVNHNLYNGYIDSIWDRIILQHKSRLDTNVEALRVIEDRKKNHIPEFLILFYKSTKDVIIHTYINGEPYCTKLTNHIKSALNDYTAVTSLVALLAECRINNKNCDWYPNECEKNLNLKKSYIDWE